MKGLVVEAAGKICLREDLPLPEIDAYQVLCRNVGCGICNGTDMQLINGQMPFIQYPFVLGHEAVGQVVAVGEKVRSFQEGDYILRSALPGLPGYHSFWGGFAEYGVADDYAARLADHAGADIETSTRQLVPAGIDPVEATMLITLKEVASALHWLNAWVPGRSCLQATIRRASRRQSVWVRILPLTRGSSRWRTLCAAICRRVWICISMRSATRIF